MFEKSVFENLKSTRDRAFRVLQFARDEKKLSGDNLHEKRGELNSAWVRVESAQNRMNQEYSIAKKVADSVDSDWSIYRRRQEDLDSEISQAKRQQEEFHNLSQDLFQKSRDAYNYGDKSMAPYYSQQAKDMRDKRDNQSREV